MINTRKFKTSLSQIRRSKSIIHLFDNIHINSSSCPNYYTNRIHNNNVECMHMHVKGNEILNNNVEEGHISDNGQGQKGKMKRVPKGYVAVYVGEERQKFVIPSNYLSVPEFKAMMDDVGDEYGYEYEGGLRVPCEEHEFEKILRICTNECGLPKNNSKKIPSMVLF